MFPVSPLSQLVMLKINIKFESETLKKIVCHAENVTGTSQE